MTDEHKKTSGRVLPSATPAEGPVDGALPFGVRVRAALHEAGIPRAEMSWDYDKDEPCCTPSGYHFLKEPKTGDKVVDIVVIGRTDVPEATRQGERDALVQQIRAALTAAGIEVRVNEYGNLRAVNR